jgi:holo-[acyl-carrier protein] synthase
MKILGIGVDIVKNKRIKSLIKNKLFLSRTFSQNEIKTSKNISNKINYFSKRFAAKEALAKSLGTGFRNNLNFKDIEILNNKKGKPFYSKSKKIDTIIKKTFKTSNFNLFLSISDEKDYSIAFTILQKK